jgi:uncharacterized protein (DUF3820 family)
MTIFGMNVVKGLGGRGGRGEFLIETLVFLLIAFAVLELISHIFVISSSGFDLTDEGFYMLWMSNPSSYKISISQFGYLLQPIYKLANGDIYIIRVINYSLTVLIATALALAVLFNSNSLLTFIRAFVLSSAIGCSALLITFFELPQTPSYNTLLFQVFLLGACALIFIDSKLGLTRGAAIALLAFSLVMAFLLKPTAAAVFGVLALGHIVVTSARRVSTSIAIAMIAIIVFILFVCSIDDSFGKYISRITDGLKAHYLLVTGAAPFPNLGVVLFPLGGELLKIFLALLAMLLTTLFWVGSAKPGWRPIWIGICVIGDLIGIFALNQNLASIMPLGRYAGVLLMVVPFAAIIWLTITGLWREISLKNFSLSILFFILPFAYAFGTERPLWLNAQGAAIFWVLSAFVLLASVEIG